MSDRDLILGAIDDPALIAVEVDELSKGAKIYVQAPTIGDWAKVRDCGSDLVRQLIQIARNEQGKPMFAPKDKARLAAISGEKWLAVQRVIKAWGDLIPDMEDDADMEDAQKN